jgi:hypothetical protein
VPALAPALNKFFTPASSSSAGPKVSHLSTIVLSDDDSDDALVIIEPSTKRNSPLVPKKRPEPPAVLSDVEEDAAGSEDEGQTGKAFFEGLLQTGEIMKLDLRGEGKTCVCKCGKELTISKERKHKARVKGGSGNASGLAMKKVVSTQYYVKAVYVAHAVGTKGVTARGPACPLAVREPSFLLQRSCGLIVSAHFPQKKQKHGDTGLMHAFFHSRPPLAKPVSAVPAAPLFAPRPSGSKSSISAPAPADPVRPEIQFICRGIRTDCAIEYAASHILASRRGGFSATEEPTVRKTLFPYKKWTPAHGATAWDTDTLSRRTHDRFTLRAVPSASRSLDPALLTPVEQALVLEVEEACRQWKVEHGAVFSVLCVRKSNRLVSSFFG